MPGQPVLAVLQPRVAQEHVRLGLVEGGWLCLLPFHDEREQGARRDGFRLRLGLLAHTVRERPQPALACQQRPRRQVRRERAAHAARGHERLRLAHCLQAPG